MAASACAVSGSKAARVGVEHARAEQQVVEADLRDEAHGQRQEWLHDEEQTARRRRRRAREKERVDRQRSVRARLRAGHDRYARRRARVHEPRLRALQRAARDHVELRNGVDARKGLRRHDGRRDEREEWREGPLEEVAERELLPCRVPRGRGQRENAQAGRVAFASASLRACPPARRQPWAPHAHAACDGVSGEGGGGGGSWRTRSPRRPGRSNTNETGIAI